MRGLRSDAGAGPDGIGPKLQQDLLDVVAPLLTEIYNSSLNEGMVPED